MVLASKKVENHWIRILEATWRTVEHARSMLDLMPISDTDYWVFKNKVQNGEVTQLLFSISPAISSALIAKRVVKKINQMMKAHKYYTISGDIAGKNEAVWTSCQPAQTDKPHAQIIFTATPRILFFLLSSISTPYIAWKRFVYESALKSK